MSMTFGEKNLSFNGLIKKIGDKFSSLPDSRKKATANNLKYSMKDAVLSAFSVFFTQSPSFLDYQERMQKAHGKNNATSLFGVHQIPSTNQIRNLLDTVSSSELYPLLNELNSLIYEAGLLKDFYFLNNQLLIAMDGTDFFSSSKISCPCCSETKLKTGKKVYRHSAVTPVIVSPNKSQVVPLPPEFIQPQDGHEKQDCELAAAKRWLKQWGEHYAPWGATLMGDDLFCHQPYCETAIEQGFDLILVCKPSSHQYVYENLTDFERIGKTNKIERTYWNGKQRITQRYHYFNQVSLRDTDDALILNWFELTEIDAKGKEKYKNAWLTTHKITEQNVSQLASAGRARWKIENENNNVLKNNGYHFDHNFGHGKQYLSNFLATLILLAYLTHTILDWLDEKYQKLRELSPSRRAFFEYLRALTLFLPFVDWNHLMTFMLEGLTKPS